MPQSRQGSYVSVSGGQVTISTGSYELTVPVAQIDALARLLECAKLVDELSAGGSATARPAASAHAMTSAAPLPHAPRRPEPSGRKSRKRVGDKLVDWWADHPGWHHEADLLQVVIDHQMSDAAPKRALKIALGKGRGKLFFDDGHGHWRLLDDTMAGDPPAPRKKPGRPKKGKRGRGGRPTGTRAKPKREKSSLLAAAKRVKAKSGARLISRARSSSAESKEEDGASVAAPEESPSTVHRVKSGERRRDALRGESAVEADGVDENAPIEDTQALRARARRNLLGLAGSS